MSVITSLFLAHKFEDFYDDARTSTDNIQSELEELGEDKSYLDLPSVYKLVGNEWKRLPEQEYTDTFTLDNGTKYQIVTYDHSLMMVGKTADN